MFVELMSAVPNGAVRDTRSFGLKVKQITSGANIIRTEKCKNKIRIKVDSNKHCTAYHLER